MVIRDKPINQKSPNHERPMGRIDYAKVEATTDKEILAQTKQDEQEAKRDSGKYLKQIRMNFGLSQIEFSKCLNVPVNTLRNWEQGKRSPTGAARTLYRVLVKHPKLIFSLQKQSKADFQNDQQEKLEQEKQYA